MVVLFKAPRKRNTKAKSYQCQNCRKYFPFKGPFPPPPNKIMCTGQKSFQCFECGKSFSLRRTLNIHYKQHEGKEPYKCKVCGKVYNSRGGLYHHRKTHSGERPYMYLECGRSFRQSAHLSRPSKNV